MSEQQPDPHLGSAPEPEEQEKLTVFGEPLWVDTLKSMGCGLMMLLVTIIVGGALGVAIMAPWGRASFDCSIYCVIGQQFEKMFGN